MIVNTGNGYLGLYILVNNKLENVFSEIHWVICNITLVQYSIVQANINYQT